MPAGPPPAMQHPYRAFASTEAGVQMIDLPASTISVAPVM
jgi:hypothetical protein